MNTRETGVFMTTREARDVIEALRNAADDLDTEGLGDTDSCLDARGWIRKLEVRITETTMLDGSKK